MEGAHYPTVDARTHDPKDQGNPDAGELREPICAFIETDMSAKLSSGARPFPRPMLGAKGWFVVMAVAAFGVAVIIYYLKTL
ncbi:MAG: hypothetical protein ABSB26_04465 [Nitrososphaerales archaeon]|jgi:hypothetical protein